MLFVRSLIIVQKGEELGLEVAFSMMPLLILDIFHHGKKRHDDLKPEAEAKAHLQIVPRKGRVYVPRFLCVVMNDRVADIVPDHRPL